MRNKEKDPAHDENILGLLMEGKLLLIAKLRTQCGSGKGEPWGQFRAQQEQDTGTVRAHSGAYSKKLEAVEVEELEPHTLTGLSSSLTIFSSARATQENHPGAKHAEINFTF